MAISAQGASPESPIDPRFGRAAYFVIYDSDGGDYSTVDNVQNLQAAQGAGIQSASMVVNAGCTVLVTGHCGPNAFKALTKAGVQVYSVVNGTVRDAVEAFKKGTLKKLDSADVEGHW